jgi:NAD(P)-dependent dehydrogenase (short-subunit alcohol dehydrogenase family)
MSVSSPKVAVVTGAGSGLGAALATSFAESGTSVVVLDLDTTAADATASALRSSGAEAVADFVDVRDRRSLDAAAEKIRARFGRCDVLCANAGLVNFGLLEQASEEEWRWILEVNLLGVVRTVDAFLPLLREAPGDRHVVITSSGAFLAPAPRLGLYSATKFAVTGYAEVLRHELAVEGIGVSVVLPGSMHTRLLETSAAAFPDELGKHGSVTDDMALMAEFPHGEVLTAEEAAAHVLPQILTNEPIIVTHGEHWRALFENRVQDVRAALDRMDATRPVAAEL